MLQMAIQTEVGTYIEQHADLVDPDNGDYRPGGTYNGQTYYVRVDDGYYVFYWSSISQWRIAAALGNDYSYFYKSGGVDGTYTPGPHCTGNPVVAPASVSWWSYVNPTYEDHPILTAVVEYRMTA